MNNKIKIGESTLKDLAKLDLAFQLEAKHPELTFFEINRLVHQQLANSKLQVSENSKDTLKRLKIIKELYRQNPKCNYSKLFKLVMMHNNQLNDTPRKPLFLVKL